MANMADMIKKAKEQVGAASAPQGGNSEQEAEGLKIERQNVETIRGQAKSGE